MRFNGEAGAWLFARYPVEGICSVGAFFIACDLALSSSGGLYVVTGMGAVKNMVFNDNFDKRMFWIAAIGSLAIFAVVLSYVAQFSTGISPSQEVWGQFGDFFGGLLNPLISFAALIGLLATLRSQRVESERSDNRHIDTVFDSRLFQLLSLSHTAAGAVKVHSSAAEVPKLYEGHHAISYCWVALDENYFTDVARGDFQNIFAGAQTMFNKWKRFFWPPVAHYFESIMFSVEFALANAKDDDHKSFSIRAICAQMTLEERSILFYALLFRASGSRVSMTMLAELIDHGFMSFDLDDCMLPYRKQMITDAMVQGLINDSQ